MFIINKVYFFQKIITKAQEEDACRVDNTAAPDDTFLISLSLSLNRIMFLKS